MSELGLSGYASLMRQQKNPYNRNISTTAAVMNAMPKDGGVTGLEGLGKLPLMFAMGRDAANAQAFDEQKAAQEETYLGNVMKLRQEKEERDAGFKDRELKVKELSANSTAGHAFVQSSLDMIKTGNEIYLSTPGTAEERSKRVVDTIGPMIDTINGRFGAQIPKPVSWYTTDKGIQFQTVIREDPETGDRFLRNGLIVPGKGLMVQDGNDENGEPIYKPATNTDFLAKDYADAHKKSVIHYQDGNQEVSEVSAPLAGVKMFKGPKYAPHQPKDTGQGEKDRRYEVTLRKEFEGAPIVKSYDTIRQQTSRMESVVNQLQNPNARTKDNFIALDQSLIMVFNKMLDPDSVVREGEYARTIQNSPLLSRVIGKMDQIRSGGAGFTNDERKAIITMGRQFYGDAKALYDNHAQEYQRIASETGADPGRVVINRKGGGNRDVGGNTGGQSRTAADFLRKKGLKR